MMKSKAFFLCLLLLSAPLAFAQGELYSDADIGIELGQATRTHGLTLAVQGGMGNTFVAPGFAYERFFDNGKTMVHIPVNFWIDATSPERKAYDVLNVLYGSGLIFRWLPGDVASSPFYGIGMRFWRIISTYERRAGGSKPIQFEFRYMDFIPVATGGYTHRLTSNWSVTGAVELGVLFSSYDSHSNEKEDPSTGNPPSTDPRGDPPWTETGFHWTVELSGSYLF